MKKGPVLSQSNGFTLIELLISITMISVLVTFGFSAYSKSQQRQIVKTATDSLISILESTHKRALIGNRPSDCTGPFQGYQVVTIISTGNLEITPLCDTPDMTITETVPNLTFTSSQSFVYKPLTGGLDLGGSTTLDLDYQSTDNLTHRLTLSSAGNMDNIGVVQ